MRGFLLIFFLIPFGAWAQEFTAMSGAEIEQALNNRGLIYTDGATQDFRATGATLYDAGGFSWGRWAVREDQYCSQWPPRNDWACYDMTRSGDTVRFIAEDGSFSEGTFTN